ncbi:MAG TPA: hypothetical protein VH186_18730 [Chloroflexia bacterium]|nr:hypothetical protein [Chloroflexia bacterium]
MKIENFEKYNWIWHDADLILLKIVWSEDGIQTLLLRTELNPYEDRQLLINLGLNTPKIDLIFHDVGNLMFKGPGDYSLREVIVEWKIKKVGTSKAYKHEIECSGGTELSFICSQGIELKATEDN